MITRSARSVSITGYKNQQLVPCVARLYKHEWGVASNQRFPSSAEASCGSTRVSNIQRAEAAQEPSGDEHLVQMSRLGDTLKTATINEYSIISDIERSNDSIINECAVRIRIPRTSTEVVADYLRYTSFRAVIVVWIPFWQSISGDSDTTNAWPNSKLGCVYID